MNSVTLQCQKLHRPRETALKRSVSRTVAPSLCLSSSTRLAVHLTERQEHEKDSASKRREFRIRTVNLNARGTQNSWLAGKSESYCSRWIYYIKDARPSDSGWSSSTHRKRSQRSKPHSNTAVYKKSKGRRRVHGVPNQDKRLSQGYASGEKMLVHNLFSRRGPFGPRITKREKE